MVYNNSEWMLSLFNTIFTPKDDAFYLLLIFSMY